MTILPDFYPVPTNPPDMGVQHVCRIADEWIPILIGQMSALRDKSKWKNPPADIVAQIDHFIYQIESEYILPQVFPTFYSHLHQNSIVTTGGAMSYLVNTAQEFNGTWRQLTPAINDASYFQCLLAAGNYQVDIGHSKGSASAKLNVQITGIITGHLFDLYNATTLNNQHEIYTVTIPTDGLKTVNLSTNSKNASSGGYAVSLSTISFRKVS